MEGKINIETTLQIIFWMLLSVASISLMRQVFPLGEAILRGLLNVSIWVGIAYFNIYVLFPLLFKKKRWIVYFLALLGLTIAAIFLREAVNGIFFERFIPQRGFPTPNRRPPFLIIRIFPAFLFSLLILFVSTVYQLGKEFFEQEKESARLINEKVTHELHFLRSQINPHFLFNALNNLHATVQLKPQKAGDYILKLGEMLRYVLEDGVKEKVTLADEIKYLENYIFFQKQKDEKLKNVQFNITASDTLSIQLEPMLFIPLVENAFKHNYLESIEDQWVSIHLSVSNDTVHLEVKNNLGETNSRREDGFEVGLSNIKRRLELRYPGCHQLITEKRADHFFAKLTLTI
ncbi:MAG: histidine kinase [Bacteroidota bacterium]